MTPRLWERVGHLARRRRPVRRGEVATFLRAVPGPHGRSAVRALLDGVFVTATLERRGLRPLLSGGVDRGRPGVDAAREVSRAVDAGLGVLPVAPTCLRRSVTLLRELERLGLSGDLHLGVRTDPAGIGAHAWVQVGDVVVNDDPDLVATYSTLAAGDVERLMPRFG